MTLLRSRLAAWREQLRLKYVAKFVFVHINKTGGVSIERALGLPIKNHTTALEYRELVGAARWGRLFSFSVVRNPWDRVVSHYHFRIQTGQTGMGKHAPSFGEWVRRTYGLQDPVLFDNPKFFAPQAEWICDEAGELLVDRVCRLESLTQDFAEVCQRIGRRASLSHLNRTERGPYQDYYDAESRELVRRWFERDIELFDYSFDSKATVSKTSR